MAAREPAEETVMTSHDPEASSSEEESTFKFDPVADLLTVDQIPQMIFQTFDLNEINAMKAVSPIWSEFLETRILGCKKIWSRERFHQERTVDEWLNKSLEDTEFNGRGKQCDQIFGQGKSQFFVCWKSTRFSFALCTLDF